MYTYLQSALGNIGRFQKSNGNVVRFIIGDIEGIKLIIRLVHGKLRTPKNIRFNQLIDFMNNKYNLSIPQSDLNTSYMLSNSWFTGFVEADGYFGVKISSALPKSETRKRSRSESVQILFRLSQRSFDVPTNTPMHPFMETLAELLSCSLLDIKNKTLNPNVSNNSLSVCVTAPKDLNNLVIYFNKFPLLGIKSKDFKDWEKVYNLIITKEHLTESGKALIKTIQSNMNAGRYK